VDFRDISDETALIAVQGPKAQAILARLTGLSLESVARFRTTPGEVAGVECLIARTGYTGEDGFEIFLGSQRAERLFQELLSMAADAGLRPCGLGARDTLRMEAGLPLYGHELDRFTSPIEAGLGAFVKFGRGFIGEAVILAHRDGGLRKRLVGLRTEDGKSIARQDYRLYRDKQEVGVVTSGTFAPSFDRPLAMAYVRAGGAVDQIVRPGAPIEVGIRNRMVAATVVSLPFYRRTPVSETTQTSR
jgi:aminomethyltransferase